MKEGLIMKLVKCKACGNDVAKSAKICPNCGAKIKKNRWLLYLIIFFAAVIIIAASTNKSEPKRVDGNAVSVEKSGSESVHTNTEKSDEKNTDNKKTTFSVGEYAELDDVVVSMTKVTESRGSQFNKPNSGNVFLICEFEIANNSKSEINISSMLSFKAYCDGYTTNLSIKALSEKGNKNQLDGTVAAGKKFNGVVGYEVPADWKDLEIHFNPDFWNNKGFVFDAIKENI